MAFLKSSGEGLSIFLLMDASGSMEGEKIEEAKEALLEFVSRADLSRNRVGLIVFGEEASLACPLTHDQGRLERAIRSFVADGTTPLWGALKLAQDELRGKKGKLLLVVASDGLPNDKPTHKILRLAEKLKEEGVRIITVAIGDDADREFLCELASSPQDAYVSRVGQITKVYGEIVSKLVPKRD
jgi:Ca-activated chloride channel family protein